MNCRRIHRELAEEVEAHIAERVDDLVEGGMLKDAARRQARREFGSPLNWRERSRDVAGSVWFESLIRDVRYAIRTLARSPGFTSVCVVTLALGIGATTAIFSLLDGVLWKMIPVSHPEQLVFLERYPGMVIGGDKKFCDISYPLLEIFQRRDPSLAGTTTFQVGRMNVVLRGEAEPAFVLQAAPRFYGLLGVQALIGRTLQPEDEGVAVISHGFWERRLAGQPGALGSSILLNGQSYTIVGVTPREFFGVMPGASFDVSIPMNMPAANSFSALDPRSGRLLWAVARLKPGVSEEQASHSLTALLRQVMVDEHASEARPETMERHRIQVRTASQGLNTLRERFSKPVQILMALVTLILLITCANVANLLLSRATARSREMAIRISIGAGRSRLLRQLLTESLLLSLGGGLLGLLIANGMSHSLAQLATFQQGGFPMQIPVSLDLRVLMFTAGIAIATGLIFGLAPAWHAVGPGGSPLVRALHSARSIPALSKFLIAGQVALSMVLLVGAGLFVRSLQNLSKLDAGFERANLLLVSVDPRAGGLREQQIPDFYQQVLERVSVLPGVVSTSFQRNAPLSMSTSSAGLAVPGYTPLPDEEMLMRYEAVGPHYFETLGARLLSGRDFMSSDNRNAPKVAAINEAAARRYFGGLAAVGRRFGTSSAQPLEFEVIAVVANVRHHSLRQPPRPMFYFAGLQYTPEWRDSTFQVRTAGNPLALAGVLRQVIRETNPNIPVMQVTTAAAVTDRSMMQERLTATLSSLFAGLALVLACVGLSGVLSFAVERRTSEIGIRMALGAGQSRVVRMVLGESMVLVGVGVAIGLMGALAAARAAGSLLFGLSPADPVTLMMAVLMLTAVALAAAYLPARRAARIQPIQALRHD